MAMALLSFTGVYAQEEGEEQTDPVYTRVLLATIEDAQTIVADSHYTQGQSDLQTAIAQIKTIVPAQEITTDLKVRKARELIVTQAIPTAPAAEE